MIISVNRRRRLQVAHSCGRRTRRLPDDIITRGEHGTRDGEEEMVTRTGTGSGTETRMRTEVSTREGMGARTGARKGTIIEMVVERREGMGKFEVVIEVGRKTRERERRQRVTSDHSRKIRRIMRRTRAQER